MAIRMSTIKLNTDCTCLGHLYKKIANQSARTIMVRREIQILRQIRHHLEILRNEKHVQWIDKDDNNILNSIMKVP